MAGFANSQPSSPEGLINQAEQTRLQILWEKTMNHPTKFVHYEKVAVLLLSWDDTCDDLKTKQEVENLAAVFRDRYNFEVRQEKLNHSERAQAQMNEHLATFVRKYERQSHSTLIIIYYAGHGWPRGASHTTKGELMLAGNTSQKAQYQLERNCVMWERAESNIQGADVDVFLIFDCCNAGMISRSGTKRFQTLGACQPDATTAKPGKTSFTSALIWALEQLHVRKDKPFFPSLELQQMITQAPDFPKNQYPVLSSRSSNLDYIVIAPLPADNTPLEIPADQKEDSDRFAEPSYLDLRFHCDTLDDNGIKDLAKALKKLLMDRQLSARRIDFLGKNSRWKLAQWQSVSEIWQIWYETAKATRLRRQLVPQGVVAIGLTPAPITRGSTSNIVHDGRTEDTVLTTFGAAGARKPRRLRSIRNGNCEHGSVDSQSSVIQTRDHGPIGEQNPKRRKKQP